MRYQLAVYSPITARAILAAAGSAVAPHRDARPQVCDELKRQFSADDCLLCDSGTHALQVAIGIARTAHDDGAVIAIPAFSCYDVATAAIGAGGPVTLYDVCPASLAPDQESLERVLREGARVVVIAPLYGIPVDWDALEHQAQRHGAILVEDAAQGHGATWDGRPVGSLGRIATMSFGRGKGWTGGGGGAVLLRAMASLARPALAESAAELSTVAGLVAQAALGRPSVYGIPHSIPSLHLGETTYREPSSPAAMSRAAAAALLRTKASSLEEAKTRARNAARFLGGIVQNDRVTTITVAEHATPGYLRLPLRVRGGMSSFSWPERALHLGVAPSYPLALVDLPALQEHLVAGDQRYPGARALARDLVTLPTHSLVSDTERAEILTAVAHVTETR